MFGFLKNRLLIDETRTKIGVELHRQIREALLQDERATTENLSTAFTPGYIYWFIHGGFTYSGIEGTSVVDKHLRRICDGVIPDKLYSIFNSQLSALGIAQSMTSQDSPIRGTSITPTQLTELFEHGSLIGGHDAGEYFNSNRRPVNLKRYLLGQKTLVG